MELDSEIFCKKDCFFDDSTSIMFYKDNKYIIKSITSHFDVFICDENDRNRGLWFDMISSNFQRKLLYEYFYTAEEYNIILRKKKLESL